MYDVNPIITMTEVSRYCLLTLYGIIILYYETKLLCTISLHPSGPGRSNETKRAALKYQYDVSVRVGPYSYCH